MQLSDLILHESVSSFLAAGPKNGPQIMVGDIETFPMEGYFWRMWKQNISPIQVTQDVTMMSYAIKWHGQRDCLYVDQRGMGKNMRNDKRLLQGLRRVLDRADIVVAHNGQRFDLPIINMRMVQQNIKPYSPVQVYDTFLLNKKTLAFSSQALAFISPKFCEESKTEHKNFPGFHLWKECLADNPEAWAECEEYNIIDITSLEEVYDKVRPWHAYGPNPGPYMTGLVDEDDRVCPHCGSTHVIKKGKRMTQVGVYDRYVCLDCGGYSRGRTLIKNKRQRAHVLVS